jgi:hypothetical protein
MGDATPDPRAWLALCAALALVSILVWMLGLAAPLAWQPAAWPARPWLFWTGSLAHASGSLLSASLAALAVLAVLGTSLGAGRTACQAVLLAWPLGNLALLAWPSINTYEGLAGLQCSMLAVLGLHAAGRPAGWVLLALLVALLMGEQAWRNPVGYDPNWGFNVVYAAHLGGALGGLLAGIVLDIAGRRRRP